jgi:hypothetical protein
MQLKRNIQTEMGKLILKALKWVCLADDCAHVFIIIPDLRDLVNDSLNYAGAFQEFALHDDRTPPGSSFQHVNALPPPFLKVY